MPDNNLPFDFSEYIDLESGLARVMGNKAIFMRMLGIVQKSTEFAKLDGALEAGDLAMACEYAHAIKGMTGNLSFTKLFETSSVLNDEFKDGIRNEKSIADYKDAQEKTLKYIELLVKEWS